MNLNNRMRCLTLAGLLATLLTVAVARAALPTGARAPEFKAQATQAGKVFDFSLGEALSRGPVVLYFYPAAFTPGCTVEAHDFAAAMDRYHALGATVIGVSGDDIATLKRFSVSECRSKFAVAADPGLHIATAYDAVMAGSYSHANRVSYVITPDGKVLYRYASMNPDAHVSNTLDALREWKSSHR